MAILLIDEDDLGDYRMRRNDVINIRTLGKNIIKLAFSENNFHICPTINENADIK
jgi:hypothetical protein